MGEKEQAERLKLRLEIQEAMMANSPRFLRARRVTDQILALMRPFIPDDRECLRRVEEYLIEASFQANVEIISVRPEWDAMDKMKIEAAMHELKMAPILMPKS
ncbi:MAG: hypothetical protein AB7R40_23660 [Nitrospiraceae bacterium]